MGVAGHGQRAIGFLLYRLLPEIVFARGFKILDIIQKQAYYPGES